MKKKWVNVFLFCLLAVCSKAQTEGYHYYCNIDTITTSGFYKFPLEPKLNAHIKADFSDVRIVNSTGKWVPHVLDASDLNNSVTMPLNVEFERTGDSPAATTKLILKGHDTFISVFDIIARNTSANRFTKLSGSDDKRRWFAILDSTILTPVIAEKEGEVKYHIDFPACNYKYYKLAIDNDINDPLNITQVTTPVNLTKTQVKFGLENPEPTVFQVDSGKISYVRLTQPENYHIDQLVLAVSGPKYYYRKLEIFQPSGDNHSFSNPGRLLQSFYITNKSSLEFSLAHANPKVLYIQIYNEDNLPLKVDAVKTRSDTRNIIAYLEKSSGYKLIMENISAVMPDYDLTKLKIIIPDSAQYLTIDKLTAFEEKKSASSATTNNKWILWTAIAIAIIILLFFTSKMLKEVDKRKSA